MGIDVNLIWNFLIAIFLYNIILKAIGATILKQFFKSDEIQEAKKSFNDKIKEKFKENE